MDGVDPGGKTDPQILREVLDRNGLANRPAEEQSRFFSQYLAEVQKEIDASERFRVLPGVREVLSKLDEEKTLVQGLATGNLEEAATLKLERAGLTSFFRFGGFGSDAEDRTELVRVAVSRARRLLTPAPLDAVFVIGDTPLDILHGKAAGARTVAVASGSFSLEALRAHEPDFLVPSLEPTDAVVAFLNS